MANNVEIKAEAFDFDKQLELAKFISNTEPVEIIQRDVFFNVSQGRLKLRIFSSDRAELIFYTRPDNVGPKLSNYEVVETNNPKQLENILRNSNGVKNIVEKTRLLLMCGRTRMHFDKVNKLGNFIELEVVLENNENFKDGEAEAIKLMKKLEIEDTQLVSMAYVDLLESRTA